MKRSQLCGAWDTRSLDFMTQEVSLCTMLPICWISFSLTSTNWTTNPGYSAGNYTWLFAITCLEATIFPRLQFEAYLHFTCSFKIRLFFYCCFFFVVVIIIFWIILLFIRIWNLAYTRFLHTFWNESKPAIFHLSAWGERGIYKAFFPTLCLVSLLPLIPGGEKLGQRWVLGRSLPEPARTVKLFVQQMNLSLMYCCWLQEGLHLGQTSPASVIAMLKSSFLSNVLPRMLSGQAVTAVLMRLPCFY